MHQVDGCDRSVEPLVGGQGEPALRDRPCILVEGNDTHVEVESACTNELQEPRERRLDIAALDPGHGWLRDPGKLGKTALREPRPEAALLQDLSRIHTGSIRSQYRFDAFK